jgi:hypothetical protein
MFDVDMRTMQYRSTASIIAQWYGLMPKNNPGFQLHYQILVIMCGGNCMTMDPSVYPHHMNVVKHLVYVICAFRNHSPGESTASTTAQWHGMMPSSDSEFQPTPPICANSCGGSSIVRDLPAHPHNMNVVTHHGNV